MKRWQKAIGSVALLACGLVGGFEGLQQTAYRDVVGVPTICYGETKGVRMGMTATKAECDAMLLRELAAYERGMLACLNEPLPVKTQIAFLSATYNIGIKAFCGSSMARRWNAGDHGGSCDALLMWNKAGGVEWRGLTKRRAKEREICREGLQ